MLVGCMMASTYCFSDRFFLLGRRSISKFYNGKSKSFACLKEAITFSGSAKDITKAENP